MTLTPLFLELLVFFKEIVGVEDDSPKSESHSEFLFDKTTFASFFALAYILQGVLVRFFPSTHARWYGWGETTTSTVVMSFYGDIFLYTGIGAVCVLLLEGSVCSSIGAIHAANVVSLGLRMFNARYQQLIDVAFYACWAFIMVGAYAGLAETSWCTIFFKVVVTLHALVAAQLAFFPSNENISKVLNVNPNSNSDDDKLLSLASGTGLFYLGLEAFLSMILYGEEAPLALGCASLFGVVHFIDVLLVTRSARKQTLSCVLYTMWLVFFLIMIPLCLGLIGAESTTVTSTTQ